MIELATPDDIWSMYMLEKYLPPQDVRFNYDKAQAIECVCNNWRALGELWLVDKDKEVFFRCVIVNPKVLSAHIMGNGLYFRSAVLDGIQFIKQHGVAMITVWTQHEKIGRIVSKLGFTKVATLPSFHMVGDDMLDIDGFFIRI